MNVLVLTADDRRLLSTRVTEYGNSQRRMVIALREAGAADGLARLRVLRRMERRFAVDLGSLCDRYARRNEPDTHPIERIVLGYVARSGGTGDDGDAIHADADAGPGDGRLWVLLDRILQVRELMEEGGELVREP